MNRRLLTTATAALVAATSVALAGPATAIELPTPERVIIKLDPISTQVANVSGIATVISDIGVYIPDPAYRFLIHNGAAVTSLAIGDAANYQGGCAAFEYYHPAPGADAVRGAWYKQCPWVVPSVAVIP